MKIFNKPTNLNGSELKAELAQVGIIVGEIFDLGDGTIGFETDEKATAEAIVESHNGNIVPTEPTIEDKLSSIGLNLNDLKTALGLS